MVYGVEQCVVFNFCFCFVGSKSSTSSTHRGGGRLRGVIYICICFVRSKSSRAFGGRGSHTMSNLCLQLAILVGKVAKVAYFTGVEGCAHCQRFIFVYALSVAKVAEVARLVGVEGPDHCLVYVCSGLFGM